MKTINVNIYSFDELSDDAKKHAVNKWIEDDAMPWLEDFMHEEAGRLMQEYGFTSDNAHAFYSLSYSQGDGAMLTGDFRYKGYTFTVEHYGHYYHENSKQITEITRNNGNNISDATWRKMFDEFEPKYVALCKELRDMGYKAIEYEADPDNVAEYLRANDYEFYEDGKFYYG